DRDGDEERVLATDEVSDAAEDDGAEGPDEEAGGVRDERREQRRGVVPRREEELREERSQDRVEIEVVPLEHRAQRGSKDGLALLGLRHDVAGPGRIGGAHSSPPWVARASTFGISLGQNHTIGKQLKVRRRSASGAPFRYGNMLLCVTRA